MIWIKVLETKVLLKLPQKIFRYSFLKRRVISTFAKLDIIIIIHKFNKFNFCDLFLKNPLKHIHLPLTLLAFNTLLQ
jgi:hypothetical protein